MMSTPTKKGFTLIELIVSIGLFTIVTTIAMTALLRVISLSKVARATNDVSTNLSFAIDTMARGIRTGSVYNCNDLNRDCPADGASKFSYLADDGQTVVTYILATNAAGSYIGVCSGVGFSSLTCNTNTATAITDPRINVTSLKFYSRGIGDQLGGGDDLQPQVIFTVKGVIQPDPTLAPVSFALQSGATQRIIDQ